MKQQGPRQGEMLPLPHGPPAPWVAPLAQAVGEFCPAGLCVLAASGPGLKFLAGLGAQGGEGGWGGDLTPPGDSQEVETSRLGG